MAAIAFPVFTWVIGEGVVICWGGIIMGAIAGAILMSDNKKVSDVLKEKQGKVHQEFPGQWADKTIGEVEKAARSGDKSAQKAKKILTDQRFNK